MGMDPQIILWGKKLENHVENLLIFAKYVERFLNFENSKTVNFLGQVTIVQN